jgi:hypothetical protein
VNCDPVKLTAENAPPSVFNTLISAGAQKRLNVIRRDNPSRLKLFERVYSGAATRNQCIKAQCLDCQGFDSVAVKDCGDSLCPLHKFRPFQRKGASE